MEEYLFFRTAIAFPVMVSFLYTEHWSIIYLLFLHYITSSSSSASSGKALSAPSATKNCELWMTCYLGGKVRRETWDTRNAPGRTEVGRSRTKTRRAFSSGRRSGPQQVWTLSWRSWWIMNAPDTEESLLVSIWKLCQGFQVLLKKWFWCFWDWKTRRFSFQFTSHQLPTVT